MYPHFYSYAKDKLISVKEFLSPTTVHEAFHLPLSVEAFAKYNALQDFLTGTDLTEGSDRWCYQFNKGIYSSSSFYKHQFSSLQNHLPSKMVWQSKCMSKPKFFAWLIFMTGKTQRT
jgi:hypothetical protein